MCLTQMKDGRWTHCNGDALVLLRSLLVVVVRGPSSTCHLNADLLRNIPHYYYCTIHPYNEIEYRHFMISQREREGEGTIITTDMFSHHHGKIAVKSFKMLILEIKIDFYIVMKY